MDIGAIESQMDDINDLLEDSEEIQEALGRSYDVGEGFDEEELEGELEAMEAELEFEDGDMSYLSEAPLPEAPVADAPVAEVPVAEEQQAA